MAFFNSAVGVLQTLVIALGAGLGIWGVINLLEGYGSDNPGAKSQGMKQLMAGGGIILLGVEELADKSFRTVDLPDPEKLIKEFWDIANNPNKTSVNILSSKDVFRDEQNKS